MAYKFDFRPYRRRFKPPLQTNHGIWEVRDSIILRLTNETGTSYGEIAPVSWFGSETVEQALDFCRQLPNEITEETIFSIPTHLPACQFGFESAWEGFLDLRTGGLTEHFDLTTDNLDKPAPTTSDLRTGGLTEHFDLTSDNLDKPAPTTSDLPITDYQSKIQNPESKITYSALLPAGEAALSQWRSLWEDGYRTFKWKIGVYSIADELEVLRLLMRTLPASAKLRLDANGGLSYEEANLWLYTCDSFRVQEASVEIEFIEQPLSVEQFAGMEELSACYFTPIALDESVATLIQMQACYQQGWRGIFVVKPSIVGSPRSLRQFCQARKIDAVFSSVFETAVGRQAALKLAAELSINHRAVGFGVASWFEPDEPNWLNKLWKDR